MNKSNCYRPEILRYFTSREEQRFALAPNPFDIPPTEIDYVLVERHLKFPGKYFKAHSWVKPIRVIPAEEYKK